MILHGQDKDFSLTMSLDELKLIYRSIWNDLKARGRFGEDEEATDLLFALQNVLQREAGRLGVNVADHSQWAAFMGLDESCSIKPRQA